MQVIPLLLLDTIFFANPGSSIIVTSLHKKDFLHCPRKEPGDEASPQVCIHSVANNANNTLGLHVQVLPVIEHYLTCMLL